MVEYLVLATEYTYYSYKVNANSLEEAEQKAKEKLQHEFSVGTEQSFELRVDNERVNTRTG